MAHTAAVVPPLGLARRQARRLAALDGASPSAIVETISLWPLGVRLTLSAHGIIDYNAGEDAADAGNGSLTEQDVKVAARRGEPLDFGITETGLQVIEKCALWARDHPATEPPAPSEKSADGAFAAPAAAGHH